ncbi:MAG: efflux RND transporter periplasmic adaptor subunit [Clostridia bacterium]|nr:efflux RND transporter periplasmic adaptor subunit [Clostridia bacterium]
MRKRTAYAFMLGITITTVGAMLWLPKESARLVRARPVEGRHIIEERVEGGGVVGRSGEYTVSSLTGGVVAQVFVSANQKVEAGQALFRLESDAQEQALVSAMRTEAIAAPQVLEVDTQWLADARDDQTRQQTEALQARIAANTVRAMEGGEVLATYIHAGEVLLPGAPALTLAQERQVVRMQVGERESLRLTAGLRARFFRDDELLGEGTVLSVGMPMARQDGVLSVAVELTPDHAIALPTGARLDVEIICRAQQGAMLVPLEALVDESVWLVYGQRAWRTPVRTGLQDALHVAVEGLLEGALVILHPPMDLQEGELVEVSLP